MKRVSLVKTVSFLTLETKFPVFHHRPTMGPIETPINSTRPAQPFEVLFNEHTEFYKNSSLFRLVPSPTGGKSRRRKLKRRQTKRRV